MGKAKKGGKRITKRQLSEMLVNFFSANPERVYTFKEIFRALHLDTHPAKMLAVDTMEEMAWDDFLVRTSINSYQLNTKGQVQEGVFRRKSNGKNSFVPSDGEQPIFVSERNSMGALDGDKVRVSVMARRQNHIKEAKVIEILERKKDTFVGKLVVGKDIAFLKTNDNLARDILIPKKRLKKGQTDDKAVVKIVSWPDEEHTNMIGEVVADVSHYVHEGDIIDREAERRATSIYLVDRTIPMLPERLCNFVCSLRPDEDKLCYSVVFNLDEDAMVRDYRIVHTIIRSNRRYAYEDAQKILEDNGVVDGTGEPTPKPKDGKYRGENAEQIVTLDRLAKRLRAARFKNGAVKFDSEELRFDIDEKGKPIRCYFKRSKDANKLIEEFMLLANRTVAESVGKTAKGRKAKTLPYRVHDNPDPQKMETLREFIAKFGYRVKTDGTKKAMAKSINRLMEECEGHPEQNLIQKVALRAMMKAKYTTKNIGHFGLAFDYYTHFTSPIRRYPDTMVHRLLTRYAEGGRSANAKHYEELCEHCSDMELVAQNAERDSIKYKMVEFMGDHLGEQFDAHISGITAYGIYAEIDENHCEGMIPMRDLDDDYYEFDERNFCLVGRRRHHKYQLGDAVRIQVAKTNLEKKQLDFTLVGNDKPVVKMRHRR